MLFTFPSRYLFAIGLSGVFSLTRWSWQIQTGFHVPRPTQGTARMLFLTYTGLSPSVVGCSKTILLQNTSPYCSPTTPILPKQYWFRLIPFRSPLLWNHYYFLFLWVLRCFSSPRSPSSKLEYSDKSEWVAPFGNLRISSYLPIPVAYRSLSRPSSPLRAKASSVRP